MTQGKLTPKEYMAYMATGQEVTLPSGLVVQVKPVNSDALLRGTYPDALMDIIRDQILTRSGLTKSAADIQQDAAAEEKLLDTYKASMDWMRLVAKNAIISPKIVDGAAYSGADDEMPISALALTDLYWLGRLLDLPLSGLFRLCAEQNAAMERLFNGQSNLPDSGPAPEPPANDPGVDAQQPVSAVPVVGGTDDDQRVVDNLPSQ